MMSGEVQAGDEQTFLRKSSDASARAAQGVVGSPSLEVLKNEG